MNYSFILSDFDVIFALKCALKFTLLVLITKIDYCYRRNEKNRIDTLATKT